MCDTGCPDLLPSGTSLGGVRFVFQQLKLIRPFFFCDMPEGENDRVCFPFDSVAARRYFAKSSSLAMLYK